ncbi:MAG: MBL fold metallo-hydrolase, partial [Methanomicrobiales archaeon]|nr:MBL fold metallo-hydrolase [Methanomicrobiales archaeon]
AFNSVLSTGKSIRDTSGDSFFSDIQEIPVSEKVTLSCFQLPCGGNVFALSSPEEVVLIDTGYGSYHSAIMKMFRSRCIDPGMIRRIIITHGDADHAGGAGHFPCPSQMTPETLEIIQNSNRAYGSREETSVLEAVYTKLINTFSSFSLPSQVRLFDGERAGTRGSFTVLSRITIGDITFEVLGGLGGHLVGQIYLYTPDHGLLFTADTVMNFGSFTPERRAFNTLAVNLVTSVNVNREIAAEERKALLLLAEETDRAMMLRGGRCLICGGHGAVSVLEKGQLCVYGPIEHYPSLSAISDTHKK